MQTFDENELNFFKRVKVEDTSSVNRQTRILQKSLYWNSQTTYGDVAVHFHNYEEYLKIIHHWDRMACSKKAILIGF